MGANKTRVKYYELVEKGKQNVIVEMGNQDVIVLSFDELTSAVDPEMVKDVSRHVVPALHRPVV